MRCLPAVCIGQLWLSRPTAAPAFPNAVSNAEIAPEFSSLDQLAQYVQWYTVLGSFGQYFNSPRRMDVEIKPTDTQAPVMLSCGFKFPDENTDLS